MRPLPLSLGLPNIMVESWNAFIANLGLLFPFALLALAGYLTLFMYSLVLNSVVLGVAEREGIGIVGSAVIFTAYLDLGIMFVAESSRILLQTKRVLPIGSTWATIKTKLRPSALIMITQALIIAIVTSTPIRQLLNPLIDAIFSLPLCLLATKSIAGTDAVSDGFDLGRRMLGENAWLPVTILLCFLLLEVPLIGLLIAVVSIPFAILLIVAYIQKAP